MLQTQANATAVQTAASTDTATGIAPEATAAPKAHEAASNSYGFEALWSGADVVAKTVLILLLIMSAGRWYSLAVKVFEQAKMANKPAQRKLFGAPRPWPKVPRRWTPTARFALWPTPPTTQCESTTA